ncbi:stage II sporulation protein P [Neobacillus niacini]|uniref:stage II sporulation protein P n=1 Tax=Neobacillus niacini TaxID=86668 RepID=UPI00285E70F5|nr:stage II sporulation protein P [Neobacillus niacini]MDR6999909.1 stage II sporulation protein P [Neobacillus niacini]
MQTENELFELIKETYPLNPRPDFVSATDEKLRQSARKLTRKRKIKRASIASFSIVLSALVISWFFFLNGSEMLKSTFSSIENKNSAPVLINEQKPVIFIYQTHNWESFIPEINETDPAEATDQTTNITLVGERLSDALNRKGVRSIQDQSDILGILKVKGLSADKAYAVSREPLKNALKYQKSIKMAFDVHRDSLRRKATTIKINGKDYARICFVISSSNKHYQENLRFVKLIHKKLEMTYPGLSRGVVSKPNVDTMQNTYNQDLLGKSALVEIGGVDNTLKEEYRSADALAEVMKEILNQ